MPRYTFTDVGETKQDLHEDSYDKRSIILIEDTEEHKFYVAADFYTAEAHTCMYDDVPTEDVDFGMVRDAFDYFYVTITKEKSDKKIAELAAASYLPQP